MTRSLQVGAAVFALVAAVACTGAGTPSTSSTGTASTETPPGDTGSSVTAEPGPAGTAPSTSTVPDVESTVTTSLAGTTVTVLGPESTDIDVGALEAAFEQWSDRTGIEVVYTGVRDASDRLAAAAAAGEPPDVFVFRHPGQLAGYALEGALIPLPAGVEASMASTWSEAWTENGRVDGVQFGVPTRSEPRSLVWYQPGRFAAAGYSVPDTWDALVALTSAAIAAGDTPWCVGLESGPATGWPFTDWVEDLMLRFHGPEVYDQWVAHEIPFDDARVAEVWGEVLDLWSAPGAVHTSAGSIVSTPYAANAAPLVAGDCLMHRQASFFSPFFPEGTKFADPDDPAAVDVFYFPSVHGDRPLVDGGTLAGAFRDAPEVWELMAHLASAEFAETRQRAQAGLAGGIASGFLSAARGQEPDAYSPLERSILEIVSDVDVVRFDGSALMPTAVGYGSFWTEATRAVGGEVSVGEALATIEASWP